MNTKNNSTISRFFGALIILFCFVAVSGSAHAAFIAYICDDALCTGGGDVIVTDQGVGDNFPGSAALGQINSGALNIGGFTIVTNVKASLSSGQLPNRNSISPLVRSRRITAH